MFGLDMPSYFPTFFSKEKIPKSSFIIEYPVTAQNETGPEVLAFKACKEDAVNFLDYLDLKYTVGDKIICVSVSFPAEILTVWFNDYIKRKTEKEIEEEINEFYPVN